MPKWKKSIWKKKYSKIFGGKFKFFFRFISTKKATKGEIKFSNNFLIILYIFFSFSNWNFFHFHFLFCKGLAWISKVIIWAIQKASVSVNMFNSLATGALSKGTSHFQTPCTSPEYFLYSLRLVASNWETPKTFWVLIRVIWST